MVGRGRSKKETLADGIAESLGAGRPIGVETVDFSDLGRAKTCLELDFPIVPINRIAAMEAHAGVTTKPIYQMSKWWARRPSSVFRSLLLAATMRAPDDPTHAAKAVWDVYYANHQKRGALKHLKVADIFMGGGTTVVEGARLGLQMFGTDLNPVAWFVVKTEIAQVEPVDVERVLDSIEAEVKPQIIPFYACDCPRGHRGKWTRLADNTVMGAGFDPLALKPEERREYRYDGPEMIYVFWGKHGPCQVRECGHRTPIMSSPVMAEKTLTVKAWQDQRCKSCERLFDMEEGDARMAPGVALVLSDEERPFAVVRNGETECPHCRHRNKPPATGKPKNKKVELSLLIHPDWLAGTPGRGPDGRPYGGCASDSPEATAAWNEERARRMKLIEVRGTLPESIRCPDTGIAIDTAKGTVPKKSSFECGGSTCGRVQDVLEAVKASGKTGPLSPYAIQGYCPACDHEGRAYGGRFFSPVTDSRPFDAACREWFMRRETDLSLYWPRSELPYGFMTSLNNGGLPNHGYTHWWKMFNPRQLLAHAQLLKAIAGVDDSRHLWTTREFVLGAFQQYLRNQNMLSFWHRSLDTLAPALSSANFHPKSTVIETGVFSPMGYGPWKSVTKALFAALKWHENPWELVRIDKPNDTTSAADAGRVGNTAKVVCGDRVAAEAQILCSSATDLSTVAPSSFDLVVTDPPFGGLLHYSELSDFFYVWLRLVLRSRYPDYFSAEYVPKTLEVVANRARQPENSDGFYKRLLTECWREAYRILKPAGMLIFTFHHSEDEPWVAVLESLFDAGFYLEATYPIRSDETKGEGAKPGTIGSQKIEYDIVHVCRKRLEEPKPVSWAKLRREVLQDVQQLKTILQHHVKAGLPAADLQVIKRGKALEYYSRHYGKVFFDESRTTSVRQALLGINQLLDEDLGKVHEPPPVTAEPDTRLFLRIFDGHSEQPRDQVQKFLKGTGVTPDEFQKRGWCIEEKKIYRLVPPLDLAKGWHGRHRNGLTSDYDQAMFLIGACFDGSGINATDTLNNENLRPHPAIKDVIEWHVRRGAAPEIKNAATRALALYKVWEHSKTDRDEQTTLF